MLVVLPVLLETSEGAVIELAVSCASAGLPPAFALFSTALGTLWVPAQRRMRLTSGPGSSRSPLFLPCQTCESCEGRYFAQMLGTWGRAWLSKRFPPQPFTVGTPKQQLILWILRLLTFFIWSHSPGSSQVTTQCRSNSWRNIWKRNNFESPETGSPHPQESREKLSWARSQPP